MLLLLTVVVVLVRVIVLVVCGGVVLFLLDYGSCALCVVFLAVPRRGHRCHGWSHCPQEISK